MSPIPVAAAAGVVKAKTAKEMALFAKSMNKTDWDGVNNAMQSIKEFGASASLVQETLGDIRDQAQSLVDIALGTWLSTIAEKFNQMFESLVPLATAFDELNGKIMDMNVRIDVVPIDELGEGMLDVRQVLDDWGQAWGRFFGIISDTPPPPEEQPYRPPGPGYQEGY